MPGGVIFKSLITASYRCRRRLCQKLDAMGRCSVCNANTRYQCITCGIFICNRNLDCHVSVDEDDYDDWQLGRRVALCHRCHDNMQAQVSDSHVQQESNGEESNEVADSPLPVDNLLENDDSSSAPSLHGLRVFEIECASRGFQVYRDVWNPRMGEKLNIQHEHGNVHDPFAMTLSVKGRGLFVEWEVVGDLPREISRFCYYFLNYGGALEGRVRDRKYRASPIPSGGIEIPITLVVKLHEAEQRVFRKMKDLLREYYMEPEDVPSTSGQHNEAQVIANGEFDEDLDLEPFQPTEEDHQGEEDDDDEDGGELVGDSVIAIDDSGDEVEGHDQTVIVLDD